MFWRAVRREGEYERVVVGALTLPLYVESPSSESEEPMLRGGMSQAESSSVVLA